MLVLTNSLQLKVAIFGDEKGFDSCLCLQQGNGCVEKGKSGCVFSEYFFLLQMKTHFLVNNLWK